MSLRRARMPRRGIALAMTLPTAIPLVIGNLLLAGGPATAAQEPKVYRCGNEYRHHPCLDGRVLGLRREPGDAEAGAAREVAERQRRLADTLARDRRRLEQAAVDGPAGIVQRARHGLRSDDREQDRPSRRRQGERAGTADEDFTAIEPGSRSTRRSPQSGR